MAKETIKEIKEGHKQLGVPVAILVKNGEVFAVREKNPRKYVPNNWSFLIGRTWRGEEKARDLITLCSECGFRVTIGREVGRLQVKDFYGNSVSYNFYTCPVVGGEFSPQLVLPDNPGSHYNHLAQLEGRWFKPDELARERFLDALVIEGLKLLQDDQSCN